MKDIIIALIGAASMILTAVISYQAAVDAARIQNNAPLPKKSHLMRNLLLVVALIALAGAIAYFAAKFNSSSDNLPPDAGPEESTSGDDGASGDDGGASGGDDGASGGDDGASGGDDGASGGDDGNTAEILVSGSCGEGVSWQLTKDGSLTIYGSGAMETGIANMPWFKMRDQIYKVSVQNGVTAISDYAFQSCELLTDVVIADSVEEIGQNAFSNCAHLTTVEISASSAMVGIGGYAFYDCGRLESFYIPEGVRKIESWTFARCKSLKDISIPDSMLDIGSFAFVECTSLGYVSIPSSATVDGSAFYKSSATTIRR